MNNNDFITVSKKKIKKLNTDADTISQIPILETSISKSPEMSISLSDFPCIDFPMKNTMSPTINIPKKIIKINDVVTAITKPSFVNMLAISREQSKESTEKQIEESTEKQIEESTEKPIEESTEKQIEESTEKPIEESAEKPIEESPEKPIKESTEKPIEESKGKSINDTVKKIVKKPIIKPIVEPIIKPIVEPIIKPIVEPTKKSIDEPSNLYKWQEIAHNQANEVYKTIVNSMINYSSIEETETIARLTYNTINEKIYNNFKNKYYKSNEMLNEAIQSVIEPTQSVIEPTQSVIEATQSVIEPTQSAIETTQLVIEPTQSVIETTLPIIEITQSVIPDRKPLSLTNTPKKLEFNKLFDNKIKTDPTTTMIELRSTSPINIDLDDENIDRYPLLVNAAKQLVAEIMVDTNKIKSIVVEKGYHVIQYDCSNKKLGFMGSQPIYPNKFLDSTFVVNTKTHTKSHMLFKNELLNRLKNDLGPNHNIHVKFEKNTNNNLIFNIKYNKWIAKDI